MKCPVCGTLMKRTKHPYTATRASFILVLTNVAAYVCDQCGEVYYPEETVKKIQDIIMEIDVSSQALVTAT